jgi:hypothetical protein
LAIRLAIPDYLWEEVFEPAIQAADTDSYRANLVSILDCLSNETALEHVAELREAPGSRVLQQAATRAMSRWSHMDIGEYWLEVANNPQSTAADLKDATAGLIRVVQSDSVKGKEWEKAEFGMEALRSLKEDDVKRELLEVYRRKDSLRKELLDSLEPYLQLAEEIESLMAEDG